MDDLFFADLGLAYSEDAAVRADQIEQIAETLRAKKLSVRPPIPQIGTTVDDFQQSVIESDSRTIRLIAPAGSGKTQTMINRVIRIVRDGMEPERLLLLTFDNAAAHTLRMQLEQVIGRNEESADLRDYFSKLPITTLNSFANRLLREFFPAEQKTVAEDRVRYSAFRKVREDFRARYQEKDDLLPANLLPQYYLDLFGLLKNEAIDPRKPDMDRILTLLVESRLSASLFEVQRSAEMEPERVKTIAQIVAAFFVLYDRELRQRSRMDFDDQKLRLHAALLEDKRSLELIRARFDEIIVDEFQDINRLDFELIKSISQDARLVVTGDDDQAIYGFRGCSPDYIIDLPGHLGREVHQFELQVNYRSPANIVQHASTLIAHNKRRIPKSPIAHHEHDATISLIPTVSSTIEAKTVREFTQQVEQSENGVGFKDLAILYRTNAQSLPLQIEFLLAGIPYSVRREDNVLESESLGKLLSLLRSKLAIAAGGKAEPVDQINVFKSYLRFVTPEQERQLDSLLSKDVDLLSDIGLREVSGIFQKFNEVKFRSDLDDLVSATTLGEELQIIGTRFKSGLKGMIGNLEQAMQQEVPLSEVFDMALDYEGNTQDFLEMIEEALAKGRSSRAGYNSDGVSLLTYFGSKGRQWHTVILLSCNEGFIPHALAQVEDERRLFYVAMTRATSNLVLSYVENAVHRRLNPSRFLSEAGFPA